MSGEWAGRLWSAVAELQYRQDSAKWRTHGRSGSPPGGIHDLVEGGRAASCVLGSEKSRAREQPLLDFRGFVKEVAQGLSHHGGLESSRQAHKVRALYPLGTGSG